MINTNLTRQNLQKVNHAPKKRFGQNFLTDTHIIDQIVDSINIQQDDALIEIGPGLGALTKPLSQKLESLTVIEIDRDLLVNLHQNFTLNIINQNALTVDYDAIAQNLGKKIRIVGNLPYNISTPLLFHLLTYQNSIQDMTFMLQKEVVDRITASTGQKSYGRLSVVMQYYCQSQYLLTVPNHAFFPKPKVTSAVFRLIPYPIKPIIAKDETLFFDMVRTCFNHRRKTLRAIFKKFMPDAPIDFASLDIDDGARPETLTVAQFVQIANYIYGNLAQ